MQTDTTFDRLCALLRRDYKLTAEQLTADATLESLNIDSLGVAELLFTVEDEFKISLPSEPVELLTIGDVAQFIDRFAAAQHSRGDITDALTRAAQPKATSLQAP